MMLMMSKTETSAAFWLYHIFCLHLKANMAVWNTHAQSQYKKSAITEVRGETMQVEMEITMNALKAFCSLFAQA